MPSFDQVQKAKFLLAGVILTALLVLMVVVYQRNRLVEVSTQQQVTNVIQTRAELSISPNFNVASLEDEADFAVSVDSKGEFVKGLALRIVFPYDGATPLLGEKEKPFDLMDLPVEQGWIVAVNSIEDTGSSLIADFSAVNTNPEGFQVTPEAPFAMLRLATTTESVTNGVVSVEVEPSKLALRDGRVMEFTIDTKSYTIK